MPKCAPEIQTISRPDNAASFFVSESHLSTKPLMALCEQLQGELKDEFDILIVFEDIAGVEK